MPFSSDGDTIDFIYGVINWKTAEAEVDWSAAQSRSIGRELRMPKLDAMSRSS